jgi:predicted lipid carrier protein YhbT
LIEEYLKTFKEKLSEDFKSKNIYFELIDKNEIFSLRESIKVENIKKEEPFLIFKLSYETFIEIVEGKKHPEDLLFNERIKISGDINLIS